MCALSAVMPHKFCPNESLPPHLTTFLLIILSHLNRLEGLTHRANIFLRWLVSAFVELLWIILILSFLKHDFKWISSLLLHWILSHRIFSVNYLAYWNPPAWSRLSQTISGTHLSRLFSSSCFAILCVYVFFFFITLIYITLSNE